MPKIIFYANRHRLHCIIIKSEEAQSSEGFLSTMIGRLKLVSTRLLHCNETFLSNCQREGFDLNVTDRLKSQMTRCETYLL
jgi:hypothetical protein